MKKMKDCVSSDSKILRNEKKESTSKRLPSQEDFSHYKHKGEYHYFLHSVFYRFIFYHMQTEVLQILINNGGCNEFASLSMTSFKHFERIFWYQTNKY